MRNAVKCKNLQSPKEAASAGSRTLSFQTIGSTESDQGLLETSSVKEGIWRDVTGKRMLSPLPLAPSPAPSHRPPQSYEMPRATSKSPLKAEGTASYEPPHLPSSSTARDSDPRQSHHITILYIYQILLHYTHPCLRATCSQKQNSLHYNLFNNAAHTNEFTSHPLDARQPVSCVISTFYPHPHTKEQGSSGQRHSRIRHE